MSDSFLGSFVREKCQVDFVYQRPVYAGESIPHDPVTSWVAERRFRLTFGRTPTTQNFLFVVKQLVQNSVHGFNYFNVAGFACYAAFPNVIQPRPARMWLCVPQLTRFPVDLKPIPLFQLYPWT